LQELEQMLKRMTEGVLTDAPRRRSVKADGPRRTLLPIPQEVLAEIVGTTRSRVNVFMNKFRERGLIDYNDSGLTVHLRRLRVVLCDSPAPRLLEGTHLAQQFL
jgi:CRP-like cAMP-binding protein